MPSREVFRLKLRFQFGNREAWLFKHAHRWYITGNPKNAQIPSFDTEEAAWKAVGEVQQHWPFTDISGSLFVVRVMVSEPVYDGPRPTVWEKICDDEH